MVQNDYWVKGSPSPPRLGISNLFDVKPDFPYQASEERIRIFYLPQ